MMWDNIKYLFQIPLGWFKAVHDRVFKAYGTNFITVREDEDGATQIAVDDVSFEQAVKGIVGGDYVDLSSDQTVEGEKTWQDDATFDGLVTVANTSTDTTKINGSTIRLESSLPSLTFANSSSTSDVATISRTHTGSAPDHLILFDAQRVEVKAGNSNTVRATTTGIKIVSDNAIALNAPANQASLLNSPDSSAQGTAIATVGYCKANFVRTVNSTSPDANGNVEINVGVKTVNNTAPDANGNVNVSGGGDTSTCLKYDDWMSTTSAHNVCPYVYSNTAFTGNVLSAITNLYTWVGALAYQTLEACLIGLGFVQDSDLGDLAYLDSITVDGHVSDSNGEVSFGLAANKWMKTDASGHLATTNEAPIAIDTSQHTPLTPANPLKVITDVSWNGTTLKYSSENWTFVSGVLVSRTTNSDTIIDTPVAY